MRNPLSDPPPSPPPDSFRTWLQQTLSPQALQDLARYGASMSAIPGLIFWEDMEPLFTRFRPEIEKIAAAHGDLASIAARSKSYTVPQLVNTLVWLAVEHHARALVAAGLPANPEE